MNFFNQVNIQTPESVELEFTLAGIGNRCLALLIDYFIWSIAQIVLLVGWAIISIQLQDYFINIDDVQLWIVGISLLIFFLVYTGYFVFFETLWQGQTPGKRYVKLRVVRDNGHPVSLTQSLLRSLIRPVDDLLFLGMFFIIFGQKEKRLGDWVAGTIVVQENRFKQAQDIQISDQAQELAMQLLQDTNVSVLMPDEFAVVREYLQRRSTMDSRARATLARNLAEQASQLIGIDELPIQLSPEVFVEAIYVAYQKQSDT